MAPRRRGEPRAAHQLCAPRGGPREAPIVGIRPHRRVRRSAGARSDLGEWRPIERGGDKAQLSAAVAAAVDAIGGGGIDSAPESLALEWLRLVEENGRTPQIDRVARWSLDPARSTKVHARTIQTLEKLHPNNLGEHLRRALADPSPDVRVAALEAIRRTAPRRPSPAAKTALGSGSTVELRFAYDALAKLTNEEADAILRKECERCEAGLVPAEARLDLMEAAEARFPDAIARLMPSTEAKKTLDPILAPWTDSLYGGDAARGRSIFKNNAAVSCLRCHKGDDGEGGSWAPISAASRSAPRGSRSSSRSSIPIARFPPDTKEPPSS